MKPNTTSQLFVRTTGKIEVIPNLNNLSLSNQDKAAITEIVSTQKSQFIVFYGENTSEKLSASAYIAYKLKHKLFRFNLSRLMELKSSDEIKEYLDIFFNTAALAGTVVYFDEADSLFGKRAKIKNSNDRFKNIDTEYLLQKMENFKGLAILTTNFKNNLDKAFIRRIRFSLYFERPDIKPRKVIWSLLFNPFKVKKKLKIKEITGSWNTTTIDIKGGLIDRFLFTNSRIKKKSLATELSKE